VVVVVTAKEEKRDWVRQMRLVYGLVVMGRRNAPVLVTARTGVGKVARSKSMAMTIRTRLGGRRSLLQDMYDAEVLV
jgi:hypothetical protein